MVFQLKSYLKFLWKSKNEHGVHSPFVFSLVTKCFYSKTKFPQYQALRNYRKSLLENDNFIDVTDFGAGSKIFRSNRRQISQITKTAGITKKRAELLFRISAYFRPENILEIGTSLGLATSAVSLGNPHAKITTLEGCPETARIANENFKKFDLENIDLIIGEFEKSINSFDLQHLEFDLIYFDGNHQQEATLAYFNTLLPTATNDSVWIFDDIHWSEEMEETWEIIKQNQSVTVTIDTFQWGFVFFRKEQQKEHFVIRAQ